jgi:hypothetical protein
MTPLARTTDPLTSHEAAEIIETSTIRMMVMETLRFCGPMAPEEITEHLQYRFPWVTDAMVWRRCSDLKNDGKVYVHDAGGYRNRSGRRADVLAAA